MEAVQAMIDDALRDKSYDARLPFAIIDNASGHAVGSTSYIEIRPQDRGLEMGWIWSAPSAWDSG
jgi:RimJ/RimL family protein N-acetyltransferase